MTVDKVRSSVGMYFVAAVLGSGGLGLAAPESDAGGEPAPADCYPGSTWPTASPEQVGMDSAKLAEAKRYALRGEGSGCIIRGGKLVMAWGDQKKRYDLYSTTKSIGVTAFGLAVADGKVRLNDNAVDYLPSVGIPPESNQQTGWLKELTLFHLVTQTGGFEKTRGWCKQLFKPATAWRYSDGGPNWLADCLTMAYRRDLQDLMTERVFEPLEISVGNTRHAGDHDVFWGFNNLDRPRELGGIPRRPFGAGIHGDVDAMARIGYLYLRRGRWDGQQIIPEDFVEMASGPLPAVAGVPVKDELPWSRGASKHYGLLWWNNGDGAMRDVPRDAYWSWGLKDSFIIVVPSLDVVAARAGDYWAPRNDPKRGDAYNNILRPFLLPICQAALGDSRPRFGGRAPYLPSPVIRDIRWAPVSSVKFAGAEGESDIWVTTWADDGHLYTSWGDGWGFDKNDGLHHGSMGLARIEGGPEDFRGTDFDSEADCCAQKKKSSGAWGRKPCGILMVDHVLYLWVRNANSDGTGEQSHLGWSTDRGKHWGWADWKWKQFGFPNFIDFGRHYGDVPDELSRYLFVYSPDTPSAYNFTDHVILMRVARDRIKVKSEYQFYAGLGEDGRPVWSSDLDKRKPVFNYPGGCNRMSVTYNAPLKRYLMTMRSGARQRGPSRQPDQKKRHHFGIYDAPRPWGPWTTVYWTDRWEAAPLSEIDNRRFPACAAGWGESQRIPSKWISQDGKTIHLVFSGEDRFSVRKGRLAVADGRGE